MITSKELFSAIDTDSLTVCFTIGGTHGMVGLKDVIANEDTGEISGGNDFLCIDWKHAIIYPQDDNSYLVKADGAEFIIAVNED